MIGQFINKFGGAAAVAPVEGQTPDNAAADATVMPAAVESDKVVHIQYDAVSYNGIREANLASFGKRIIPDYDFSKARVIVSVGADF